MPNGTDIQVYIRETLLDSVKQPHGCGCPRRCIFVRRYRFRCSCRFDVRIKVMVGRNLNLSALLLKNLKAHITMSLY